MIDQIRPGIMRCAKCSLVLMQSIMNANTGSMTANTEPAQCPNNCGPMWRVTWKEAAQVAEADAIKAFDRIATLERELAEAKAREERLRKLLFLRVAGAKGYSDDGELQDSTAFPSIDFKRDDVEIIEDKLVARGIANFVKTFDAALQQKGDTNADA